METASRVTRRLVLPEVRPKFTAEITVRKTQNRKMQSAMARTVLSVRSQFLRRCLRTSGAYFMSIPQPSLRKMMLHVSALGGAGIVRDHHDGLAELLVEGLHQV